MKSAAVSSLAIVVFWSGAAYAQQPVSNADEELPEVVAEGNELNTYSLSSGNDTGTSTIKQDEVEARGAGSGDVNQLLKILPTVQFDHEEGIGTRDNILDLR